MNLHNTLSVTFETSILENGKVVKKNAPKRNLLLDSGLDGLASTSYWASFSRCVLGDGTTPTKRDSGAITVSIAGEVATASAGYFEAADVGRLLKLDSGQEVYIDGFTSATVVSVTGASDDAASEATIWYVNESGHGNELVRTGSTSTDSGDVASSWDGSTVELKRTFLFPEEASARTYKEIGWSASGTAGNNLFGRAIIPNGGDSIAPGQQYKVVVKLNISPQPVAAQAVANVGGAFDTTGDLILNSLDKAFYGVDGASGVVSTHASAGAVEPFRNDFWVLLASAEVALPAQPSTAYVSRPAGAYKAATPDAYVLGSFEKIFRVTFTTDEGNQSVYGLGFSNGGNSCMHYMQAFDAPQTKDSDHTLELVFKMSWGRSLIN